MNQRSISEEADQGELHVTKDKITSKQWRQSKNKQSFLQFLVMSSTQLNEILTPAFENVS